jgi:ElaB/YqjD/DUF883 family membrane-anchored ribosome-binding protein
MSDIEYNRVGRQAARDTLHTAANAADDISQRVGAAAADAGAAVRDAAKKVSAVASDFGQQTLERGNRYGKEVISQVESQPLTSVLIAAGAGFVAGLLLARR